MCIVHYPTRNLSSQVLLSNNIRRLWVDNNLWITILISGVMYDIRGKDGRDSIEFRLVQISDQFRDLFSEYFGELIGHRVKINYLKYIHNLELMIEAYRDNIKPAISKQRQAMYELTNELVQIFFQIGSYWNLPVLQALLIELVNSTEAQIISISTDNCNDYIEKTDAFIECAYRIAYEITFGMLQFISNQ